MTTSEKQTEILNIALEITKVAEYQAQSTKLLESTIRRLQTLQKSINEPDLKVVESKD